MSVTTGHSRCGMPSYMLISSIFGSIRIRRTSRASALYSRLRIIALMPTDLPEPVVPATRQCGILARSATSGLPTMSLPRPMVSIEADWL